MGQPGDSRRILPLLLLVALLAGASLVPLPVGVISPARPLDLRGAVVVDGRPYQASAPLWMTSVHAEHDLPLLRLLGLVLGRDAEVVPRQHVFPAGVDPQLYSTALDEERIESELVASVVALRHAGYRIHADGQGGVVEGIEPGSPALGRLDIGDIIVAVDDRPTRTAADVTAAVRRRRPGLPVRLQVRRQTDDAGAIIVQEVEVPTLPTPGEPSVARLGIYLTTFEPEYDDLPRDVIFEVGEVGGASAGLMFALAVYDAVTEGDLTGGRAVAGTGSIALDGSVGPVGGARQKLAAARRAGAAIFLAPSALVSELSGSAVGVEIIGVDDFAGAVAALRARPRR